MKECPECGGKLFVRDVSNVVGYPLDEVSGRWKCLNCKAEFDVEEEGEGLFSEDAQQKHIN